MRAKYVLRVGSLTMHSFSMAYQLELPLQLGKLVWVELVPPSFWVEPDAVVDMLAGWCKWTSGISLKVEWSRPLVMVDRV
jgi:hypothetical protein